MDTYEEATAAIWRVARRVVHNAILFDSLHEHDRFVSCHDHEHMMDSGDEEIFEIEDTSVQLICNYSVPERTSVILHRQLANTTQSIFGFKYSLISQVHDEDSEMVKVHVCLLPTDFSGPRLLKNLVAEHYVFVDFHMAIDRIENDESWTGTSLAYVGILTAQKTIDAESQRALASDLIELLGEIDQLETMSKIGGTFSPYLKLLEA